MFCEKCGAQNEPGTKFCVSCGAMMNDSGEPAPAPKKNNKTILVAVVAVLAVVLLGCLLFRGRSYEKTVDQFITATFEADVDALFKLFPKNVLDAAMEENDMDEDEMEDAIDDIEEGLEDMLDYIEDVCGDDLEVSYTIEDTDDASKSELRDLQDEYDDFGLGKIKAAMAVELEVTYEGEDDDYETSTYLTLVKMGRSWYIDPISYL